jgi:predicted CopG family antitoxin
MKKTIQLDEETARLIDEMRGNLSRSEYIDRLLKKHQGVTLSHTPDPPMEPEPDK